jgi:PAS domain S-box-containing protein
LTDQNKPNTGTDANLAGQGSNLSALLDSAYMVIGLDGAVLEVNAAALSMLGRKEAALLGQDFFQFWAVPNMGLAFVDLVIENRLVKGYQTDIKHSNDETFIASINAQLVINQTDYSKVIECLISDITQTQRKQEEFDETLRSVTGGIAHIINNQMASVVGTADLVKMELGDRPELAEQLDKISKSGIQASDVAHNLVSFADTSDHIKMEEVNINGVVAKVAEYYHQIVEAEQPRKFRVKADNKTEPIFGNEEALNIMLKHLLDNAVEATTEDEAIVISTKDVVLMHKQTGMNKKYVLLAVEDHGHGMDAATQHKIFEPFFSTRFAGRGMSLPQVLKIIKKHDGQIRIKTAVGKGSVFKVYFPIMK